MPVDWLSLWLRQWKTHRSKRGPHCHMQRQGQCRTAPISLPASEAESPGCVLKLSPLKETAVVKRRVVWLGPPLKMTCASSSSRAVAFGLWEHSAVSLEHPGSADSPGDLCTRPGNLPHFRCPCPCVTSRWGAGGSLACDLMTTCSVMTGDGVRGEGIPVCQQKTTLFCPPCSPWVSRLLCCPLGRSESPSSFAVRLGKAGRSGFKPQLTVLSSWQSCPWEEPPPTPPRHFCSCRMEHPASLPAFLRFYVHPTTVWLTCPHVITWLERGMQGLGLTHCTNSTPSMCSAHRGPMNPHCWTHTLSTITQLCLSRRQRCTGMGCSRTGYRQNGNTWIPVPCCI